jgi:hypothetical protein
MGFVEDNSGVHKMDVRFLKLPKNKFVSNYLMNQNRLLRKKCPRFKRDNTIKTTANITLKLK